MFKIIAIRFLLGGLFVSGFSILGTIFKPKSFAGLFGAAPSVALASLVLTIRSDGVSYAAIEARSMLGGAAAFFVYAWCAMIFLHRKKPETKLATAGLLVVWLVIAMGFCLALLTQGT